MPVYSILRPDYLEWSSLPGYDESIARCLTRAYRRIRLSGNSKRVYADAYDLIRPHLTFARCPFQRQRILYIRSLMHSAAGDYAAALHWLDHVIAMANELPTGDLAQLFYLRGGLNRAILRVRDAANDFQLALAFHYDTDDAGKGADPSFEISALGQLAGLKFFLGQFDTTQHLLDQARTLFPLISPYSLEIATVEWIQAHLYRLSRRSQLAVETSARAAYIYSELGAPISASRILAAAADAQLDLADSYPQGSARHRAVRAASRYVKEAEVLAVESRESASIGLVRLTAIRFDRMSEIHSDRTGSIEAVWALARRIDDDSLLAQSITALADELAAMGRSEAALAHYRDVLGLLDGSEMPTLGYPALRAVLQADEQRRD